MFSISIKSFILLRLIQVVFSETTISQTSSCYIPNNPEVEDKLFKVHPHNRIIQLGSFVEDYEVIHIECKNGKLLEGEQSLLCKNGEFSYDFPKCNNYCNGTFLDRVSVRAICRYEDKSVNCSKQIKSGTSIELNCAYGYKNKVQHLNCLQDGNFDNFPIYCEQICGPVASVSSSESNEFAIKEAPWHVAIYQDFSSWHNYICSGSIISPTVVISAAHCFWDEAIQILVNSTNLKIKAGSSSRNYSAEQTEYSQVIRVKETHIPNDYLGRAKQQHGDIVLLILAKPLRYSAAVAPICLSKNLFAKSKYMLSNQNGSITIFNKTNQLEIIPVRTVAYSDCVRDAVVSSDKFCIYATSGPVMWRSNSGAGFSMIETDISTNTVYHDFWGVLSHSASSEGAKNPTNGQSKVAITNIFNTESQFKMKVQRALEQDGMWM